MKHLLSVAPMMDWTDRFERYFLRCITRHTLLYTEMITCNALIYGDAERHLEFDSFEHPVACQLGGSTPGDLAYSAKMVEEAGYDEVNLNVGCPSDRVQSGRFGACLMAEPELVRDCIQAMKEAVSIPVTVKSRIGIDGKERFEELCQFVETLYAGGCDTFIIHARIAILSGLSPRENREVPPLKYDFVRRIKSLYPHLSISINGGIRDLESAAEHLKTVDGVMIGRAAYQDPYCLVKADQKIFGVTPAKLPTRHDIVRSMLPYIEEQRRRDIPLHHITRHMLGLFNTVPGARRWRRYLSENAYRKNAGAEIVQQALSIICEDIPSAG